MSGSIHATAIVAPDAILGEDVEIGPYCVIGPGVEIGHGTRLGAHATIHCHTKVGGDNVIHAFASIGDAPQDKKYGGESTRLEIGDRNVIREFVTLNRGTTRDRGVTTIGHDNLFMSYSHVAHDCIVGNHCVLANCSTLGGHVVLGDWVIMGGFAGVHQFCKVGAHAFLANNAAVTRDVPPYVMAVGGPAKPHSINAEGLKRRGFSPQQIRNLRNAYRTLYRSGLRLEDAVERLVEAARDQPEVQLLVDFIPQSTRSLVR
ncbi:MAG: acyl-ACP--UDP-N-acetylglucosamine O-acyltransferase [Steroidobacteraceae bacterium]|nr:acyl-ACP--UDP-N-acetylglucosamine O-acyltransferase [Steroidobacteraceae bacterium]MBP7014657.1 acyl-ACP--UDP-N-acetylglucosamine O-acyltransferase [Steroidobacteraceae bacterium]